jgi:hypothetical protein
MSPIDATDPNQVMEWLRSKFGAKTFSAGDVHFAFQCADLPIDVLTTAALLKQATQRGILTKSVGGLNTSYAFRVTT